MSRLLNRRRIAHKGMTLVELMIVVVIIGVLSILAVTGYRKYTFQARSSEAKNFLQAIRGAQEVYFQSFGQYCGTVGGETWPAQLPTEKVEWGDPAPASWQALGIKSPGWVLFQYEISAGLAQDATPEGAFIDQPQRPWFVATATADFLKSGNEKTFHEITSESGVVITLNENH